MIREDFFYDSRDGKSQIHAVRWIPEDRNPVAVLQIVHGMCEHVDRYEEFAEYLVSKGILVTAEDHLGHGKTVNDGIKGYICRMDPATVMVRDVHRLKKITGELFPNRPYYIFGHSMGSYILRNYLFQYGKGIDGAIVAGTGMNSKISIAVLKVLASFGSAVLGKAQKPDKLLKKIVFGSYLKKIDKPRTDFDWLSKDEEVVEKYVEDPMCGFDFTGNGYRALADLIWKSLKKSNVEKMPVTLRVLITSGAEDPVGDYGAGPKKLYKQFLDEGMQKIDFKIYDGDRHEILNETDHEKVYEDIYEWIVKA